MAKKFFYSIDFFHESDLLFLVRFFLHENFRAFRSVGVIVCWTFSRSCSFVWKTIFGFLFVVLPVFSGVSSWFCFGKPRGYQNLVSSFKLFSSSDLTETFWAKFCSICNLCWGLVLLVFDKSKQAWWVSRSVFFVDFFCLVLLFAFQIPSCGRIYHW